jgi:tetratricopeptide (TPR) repeat protein
MACSVNTGIALMNLDYKIKLALHRSTLQILETINDSYQQNLRNTNRVLGLLERRLFTIEDAQAWAASQSTQAESVEAGDLCIKFALASVPTLEMLLSSEKRLKWLEAALLYADKQELSSGKPEIIAALLLQKGRTQIQVGRFEAAKESLFAGFELIRELEDAASTRHETLLNLGIVEYKQSNYLKAEKYLTQSLDDAQKPSTKLTPAFYLTLGDIYHEMGELEKAEVNYNMALSSDTVITNTSKIPTTQETTVLANNRLGNLYLNRGDLDKAEMFYSSGLKLGLQMGNLPKTVPFYVNLAVIAFYRGQRYKTWRLMEKGLENSYRVGQPELICNTLQTFGAILGRLGRNREALNHLSQGLKLARQMNKPEEILFALQNTATITMLTGNFSEAETLFEEALTLAEQTGQARTIALMLDGLGELAVYKNDLIKANDYYIKSLEIAQRSEFKELIITVLANLGEVATRRLDYTAAETYLTRSMGLAEDLGDPYYLCPVLIEQASLHFSKNELQLAEFTFRKALTLAKHADFKESVGKAAFGLAKTLKLIKNGLSRNVQLYAEQALRAFKSMGHFRAIEVERWLESS